MFLNNYCMILIICSVTREKTHCITQNILQLHSQAVTHKYFLSCCYPTKCKCDKRQTRCEWWRRRKRGGWEGTGSAENNEAMRKWAETKERTRLPTSCCGCCRGESSSVGRDWCLCFRLSRFVEPSYRAMTSTDTRIREKSTSEDSFHDTHCSVCEHVQYVHVSSRTNTGYCNSYVSLLFNHTPENSLKQTRWQCEREGTHTDLISPVGCYSRSYNFTPVVTDDVIVKAFITEPGSGH